MKAKLIKLSFSLALVLGATFAAAPKAESACIAICDPSRWCCCGRVAAYDYCTGAPLCASRCLS